MKLSTKCRRRLWEEASYLVSKLRGVVDFEYFSSSFLNNNIFFYDANTDHLVAIKLVLLYFKLGMGLRVNLSESEIVLVGMVWVGFITLGIFIGRFGWDLLHHCASGYHQGAVVICSLFVWSSLDDAVEGY